jgi:hypothetical protein
MITFISSFLFKSNQLNENSFIEFLKWVKYGKGISEVNPDFSETKCIKFVIYILPETRELFEKLLFQYETNNLPSYATENLSSQERSVGKSLNIYLINFDPEKDSIIYQYCISKKEQLNLPSHRNQQKDTFEYILNSHLKHELINKTILSDRPLHPTVNHVYSERSVEENTSYSTVRYENDVFAWFDISIIDILKQKEQTAVYLNWLSSLTFLEPFITFPGCWSKPDNENLLINSVHWRFCGAFFMGDTGSLLNFCKLHKEHFFLFLEKYNTLVWDFNFWAYLELATEWSPKWYKADHNDTIVQICPDNYVCSLIDVVEKLPKRRVEESNYKAFYKVTYKYPEIYLNINEDNQNIEKIANDFIDTNSINTTKVKTCEDVDTLNFSSERSVNEKEFAVACEGNLTDLAEAQPKPEMNFSERSVEKFEENTIESNYEIIKTNYKEVPKTEKYHPMSASYLYDSSTNKHWLMTRYVNYWIYPNGGYHFYNEKHLIKSKNYLSALSSLNFDKNNYFLNLTNKTKDDGLNYSEQDVESYTRYLSENNLEEIFFSEQSVEKIKVLSPKYFKKCNENFVDLPIYETGVSIGLEDIRLFQFNGRTKFIASSIGYSSDRNSKMYIGDISNLETGELSNLKHINSPKSNFNSYEKNWIPIFPKSFPENLEKNSEFFLKNNCLNKKNIDCINGLEKNKNNYNEKKSEKNIDPPENENFSNDFFGLFFIYKWNPFQICKISTFNNLPSQATANGYSSTFRSPESLDNRDDKSIENESIEYLKQNEIKTQQINSFGEGIHEVESINIVNDESKKELILETVKTYNILNPIFNKLRGSTTFTPVNYENIKHIFVSHNTEETEYLLGVAHYSEEHSPRHYYHHLVLLNAYTLEPVGWSNGFCFEKLGIEFCIGFTIIDDIYHFWISRHDRDPILICISMDFIPLYPLV